MFVHPFVFDENTWRPYCHTLDFSRLIHKVIQAPSKNISYEIFNAGGSSNNFTKKMIVNEILKYFPSFDINLLQPGYVGIRPIMNKKDKLMRDFIIHTAEDHRIPNLINLYGIESPGLTSSLALAEYVKELLK